MVVSHVARLMQEQCYSTKRVLPAPLWPEAPARLPLTHGLAVVGNRCLRSIAHGTHHGGAGGGCSRT